MMSSCDQKHQSVMEDCKRQIHSVNFREVLKSDHLQMEKSESFMFEIQYRVYTYWHFFCFFMLKSKFSSESARLCSIGNEFLSIVKLPQAIRCTWRLSEAVPIAC